MYDNKHQNFKIVYQCGTSIFKETYKEALILYNRIKSNGNNCSMFRKRGGDYYFSNQSPWIDITPNYNENQFIQSNGT